MSLFILKNLRLSYKVYKSTIEDYYRETSLQEGEKMLSTSSSVTRGGKQLFSFNQNIYTVPENNYIQLDNAINTGNSDGILVYMD